MSWEYEMAAQMKADAEKAKASAVEDASTFIGKIEQIDPLKITIYDGAFIYEKEEIFMSRTFARLSKEVVKVGARVLVTPIDSLDTIAVIDVVEE